MQQTGLGSSNPPPARIGELIRNQVRAQVQAARTARDQALLARDQAQSAADQESQGAGTPMPAGQGQPIILVPGTHGLPLDIPTNVFNLGLAFFFMVAFVVVGLPIARALGRRLDRRPGPPAIDRDLNAQLQRIEQAVDSMSIEIERISESQRYLVRLESQRAAPEGAPVLESRTS